MAKEFASEMKAPRLPPAMVQPLGSLTCHIIPLPAEPRLSASPPARHIQCSTCRTRAAAQEPGQASLEVGATYVQILPLKMYQAPNISVICGPERVLGSYLYFLFKVHRINFQSWTRHAFTRTPGLTLREGV